MKLTDAKIWKFQKCIIMLGFCKSGHNSRRKFFQTTTVQWNPSKMDTIGEIFVLYKEVSFIQGFLNYDTFKLGASGFLELNVCMSVCLHVCVSLPPRLLITSGVMWCDIDLIQLVK